MTSSRWCLDGAWGTLLSFGLSMPVSGMNMAVLLCATNRGEMSTYALIGSTSGPQHSSIDVECTPHELAVLISLEPMRSEDFSSPVICSIRALDCVIGHIPTLR